MRARRDIRRSNHSIVTRLPATRRGGWRQGAFRVLWPERKLSVSECYSILKPVPTPYQPVSKFMEVIKAVVFDIDGTVTPHANSWLATTRDLGGSVEEHKVMFFEGF